MHKPAHILLVAVLTCLIGCAGQVYPGQATPHQPNTQRLRIVSYNIALGLMLETHNPDLLRLSRHSHSIRSALARHPALKGYDVLGLQEVCSDKDHIGKIQKSRPDLNVYFGRSDPDRDGECRKGQAILTHFPIVNAGTIRLPQTRVVGRSAIWADIQLPGHDTPMRTYNVHLENRGDGTIRSVQTLTILRHAQAWRRKNPGAPLAIIGDFNSLVNRMSSGKTENSIAHMLRRMRSALPQGANTHVLEYQTDWIFFDQMNLHRAQVVPIVRSDHFPIVADFSVTALRPQEPPLHSSGN